jgi:hypothetical protein
MTYLGFICKTHGYDSENFYFFASFKPSSVHVACYLRCCLTRLAPSGYKGPLVYQNTTAMIMYSNSKNVPRRRPTVHVLSPSATSDTSNRCPQHQRARLLILIPTPRPPTRALCLPTRPVAATMPDRLAAALALALALAATLCRATLAAEGDPRAGALALVPLNGGGGTLPDCAASNDALAQETATDEALRCFNEDGCTESCAELFLGGAMSDDGLASQVMFCNVDGAGPKCCARYMVPDGVRDPNSLLQVAMAYSASGRGADGTCLGVAPDSSCFECATAVVNQRRLDCDAIYVPAVDEPFPGPVECSSWTVDFDATTGSGDGSAGSSGSASGIMDDSSAASPVRANLRPTPPGRIPAKLTAAAECLWALRSAAVSLGLLYSALSSPRSSGVSSGARRAKRKRGIPYQKIHRATATRCPICRPSLVPPSHSRPKKRSSNTTSHRILHSTSTRIRSTSSPRCSSHSIHGRTHSTHRVA